MTFHLHLLTYVYYSTHIYTLLSTSYPPLNPLPSLLFSLSSSPLLFPSSPPPPLLPSSLPLISLKPSLPSSFFLSSPPSSFLPQATRFLWTATCTRSPPTAT